MNSQKRCLAGVLLALLLLVGCSPVVLDAPGDRVPDPTVSGRLQGTVDEINQRNQFVTLTNIDTLTSSLVDRNPRTRIYFDDRTSVTYQGNTYRPEDLERGDRVAVRFDRYANRLVATSMTVLHDVSGSAASPIGTHIPQIRGTVWQVNALEQTISIDQGVSHPVMTVRYNANTYVEHRGQRYHLEDLERGDEISVEVRDLGNDQLLAESINLVRNVSDGSNDATSSTVRGTVYDIDPVRQTIALEASKWSAKFAPEARNLLTLQYNRDTMVEYQGNHYTPTNLERGDVVTVEVQDFDRRPLAQRIVVLRNNRVLR